jgi:hypothetical protein
MNRNYISGTWHNAGPEALMQYQQSCGGITNEAFNCRMHGRDYGCRNGDGSY